VLTQDIVPIEIGFKLKNIYNAFFSMFEFATIVHPSLKDSPVTESF
jgi:hypothetical protein